MVEQPVDGGGRQRFGHELVEPAGVQVRGDRHGFAFVGGFDDAVKPFGGISADGKQPDIINDDEFSAHDLRDGFAEGIIGPVSADEHPDLLEGEPGHRHAGFDDLLPERFEEERFSGAGGPADHQVLAPLYPFQGLQRLLGGQRDRRGVGVPHVEGFPGRESGCFAAGGQHGACSSGCFFGQQCFDDLGGIPALSACGGQHVGGDRPCVRQPQRTHQRFDVAGELRGGGCGVHAMPASGVSMMLVPNRFQPFVPWAREMFSRGATTGGIQALAGQDGIEIAGSEAAVHRGVTQRPVDIGAATQRGQFDGVGHLLDHAFGAERGRLFEPHRCAGSQGQEQLFGAVRARIR